MTIPKTLKIKLKKKDEVAEPKVQDLTINFMKDSYLTNYNKDVKLKNVM